MKANSTKPWSVQAALVTVVSLVQNTAEAIENGPSNSEEWSLPFHPVIIGSGIGVIAILSVMAAAKHARPTEREGRVILRFHAGFRYGFVFLSLMATGIAFLAWNQYLRPESDDHIAISISLSVGTLVFYLLTLWFLTRRIEFDDRAVYQYSWLGKQRILFTEFTGNGKASKVFDQWVFPSAKGKLKVSTFLPGYEEFLDAFESHTPYEASE